MIFQTLRAIALTLGLIGPAGVPVLAYADTLPMDLSLSEARGWEYFSDQVMGGISQGGASFTQIDGAPVLRLSGTVSTANRGGFIQARAKLPAPLPAGTRGVVLSVRGNGEPYYVHLRTNRTLLPWQFYQASFETTDGWQEVRIPLSAFSPYGGLLRGTFNADAVRSLAVVAFGRDHAADLSVRAVGFY